MRLRMATEYDVEFMLYVQEKINKSYVPHCIIKCNQAKNKNAS